MMTLDGFKGLISDLARPFAIIVTSASASISGVIISVNMVAKGDFAGAGIFIGAIYTGVVGLYTAKAWENNVAAKQSANVAIAQAASPTVTQ